MSNVFARMKPGVTLAAAQADLAAIAAGLHREYPESYPRGAGFGLSATSLRETLTSTARPTLLILMATVGFVLLIACANVANLTLSRALGREREFAIRAAMGASRARILRQTITEGAILALAGGVLGLALATVSLDLLVSFVARFTTRAAEVRLDGTVLLFTFRIALFTGLVFGSLPAFASGQDVSGALKEFGGHASVSRRRQFARNTLVVAQVAFSLALLAGAGLMLRSLVNLLQVNPGFSAQNVLSARLTLNWSKYDSAEKARAFYDQLLDKLHATPGVVSAAIGTGVPLNLRQQPWMRGYRVEGRSSEEDRPSPQLDLNVVTPDYFQTLGIPLLRGRAFSDSDHADAPPVAVMNQKMARRDWGGQDPVGRRISLDGGGRWITIVGIIGDVRQYGLDREPTEELYLPFKQFWAGGRLLVRTRVDPAGMAELVRMSVRSIDPENPVDDFRTLVQIRGESVATPKTTAALLGIFAGLALVITSAGLFGAMALSVSQRTHEIGVRLALGATQGRVLHMVLREGMALVTAGLLLGVAGALVLTRMMSGLLFGIPPHDPITFAAVCAVLALVAAAACLVPARRAAAIDPIRALRVD
jgi:predicted permease